MRSIAGWPSALVLIGFIAFATLVTFWLNLKANEAAGLVARSIEVREHIERFLGQVRDAETGQRGYVITGADRNLDVYRSGIVSAPAELAALEELTSGDAAQFARIRRARVLMQEKFAELERAIAAVRDGDQARAAAMVREGSGERLMDDLRRVVREVQGAENALIAQRSREEDRRRLWGGAGLLLSLSALLLAGWLQLRTRQRRGLSLAASNTELERMVGERTQELENERLRIEALLRDVNHRVGNNLAMVSALLNVQSRQTRDPAVRKALGQAQSRIQAIAAGQRRLRLDIETDEIEARPYFEDLLAEIGKSIEDRQITIELDMAEIRLPGRDAVSYVVLVNELVTNALKHAFVDGAPGRITIRLEEPADGRGGLILAVEDDGVGMPPEALETGLGQTVIASLTRSMRATMTVAALAPEAERKGTKITLTFPKKA